MSWGGGQMMDSWGGGQMMDMGSSWGGSSGGGGGLYSLIIQLKLK